MIQFFSKKRGEKGFTLIELLVVIAIIGILAGIVLVALGGARDRARAARVQADLSQSRTVAELVYSNDSNSYAALCAANTLNELHGTYGTQLGQLEADITANGGANDCVSDAATFCVSSVLPTGGTWCVDSDGRSQSTGTCDIVVGAPDACDD